jgi:hypothetical protein
VFETLWAAANVGNDAFMSLGKWMLLLQDGIRVQMPPSVEEGAVATPTTVGVAPPLTLHPDALPVGS